MSNPVTEYRHEIEPCRCQVSALMIPDRTAAQWMSGHGCHLLEVHHIFGRQGKNKLFHSHCNLCLIAKSVHDFGHDVNTNMLEICCLRAKMQQEQDRIQKTLPLHPDETKWNWHPRLMAALIKRDSLEVRIEEILYRIDPERELFHRYGQELLAFLASQSALL